jgi:hypothetical protein
VRGGERVLFSDYNQHIVRTDQKLYENRADEIHSTALLAFKVEGPKPTCNDLLLLIIT